MSSDDNKGLNKLKRGNPGLEYLLDLNGEVFPLDSGYWLKFEAKKVTPNEHIPHGIKYSLTLHDKTNKRILGYDNAHAIKPKRKKFQAQKTEWDHKHSNEKVKNYEFENAGQLLEDFWSDVYKIVP